MSTVKTKIFPTSLVIESMKSSGYKDAAHAIAEVVDNSIQAAESVNRDTVVQILCVERTDGNVTGNGGSIDEIAVYDNACGMDQETLGKALAFGVGTRKGAKSGMGKFGMGLPNASISQADRVDVWSWQNGEIYHSYLDIKEIVANEEDHLSEPELADSLPSKWASKIKGGIDDSGTLVVWSELNRLKWKRHKAFFRNTEVLLGRMYRYYLTNDDNAVYKKLDDKKLTILMEAFSLSGSPLSEAIAVRPYDPAYTLVDAEWAGKTEGSGFVEINRKPIDVEFNGEVHSVVLRAAVVEKNWFLNSGDSPGSKPFGVEVNKHLGVSVVREGRELELNRTFVKTGDPKERFWAMEVHFPASLDELFGVTNNKQSATAFNAITLEELLSEEGMTEEELKNSGDTRYILVKKVIKQVNAMLRAARSVVPKAARKNKVDDKSSSSKRVDEAYKKVVNPEVQKVDEQEAKTKMSLVLSGAGVDTSDPEITEVIDDWYKANSISFGVSSIHIGSSFFSVQSKFNKTLILFNKEHEAYDHFIKPFEEVSEELDSDNQAFNAFKLVVAAFAQLELEAETDKELKQLRKVREQWGMKADEMIEALIGDDE